MEHVEPWGEEADVDPYDPETQQNPVPIYHALRREAPVFYSQAAQAYLVTRYDHVAEVLKDPATYSNNSPREVAAADSVAGTLSEIRAKGEPHVSTLATQDPPLHGQYRAVVSPFFSPAAIKRYESRAREVCAELLGGLGSTPIEFVASVAEPLPIRVTAELMSLDPSMIEKYRAWTKAATIAIGNLAPDDERIAGEKLLVEMQEHFAERISAARQTAGDDFFSALVQADIEDAGTRRPLTRAEMLSLCRQLFVGGIETTTKLMAEALRVLGEQPHRYAALRADPAAIPRFVEETLRLSSPAQGLQRRATVATTLGGVDIPAGSTVIILYAAGNRDPDVFERPDEFDATRPNLRRHLAFGKGTHFCLGAPISRMETLVLLEGLLERFVSVELVPDANDFAYEPSFILRGLKQLWLQFAPDLDPEKVSVA